MKNSLLIVFFISLLWTGCNVGDLQFDNLKTTLTSDVAIPLGEASYTMRDMIKDIGDSGLDLGEDSSSLIVLSYQDTARFDSEADIIDIANISNSRAIGIGEFPATPESRQEVVDTVFLFDYQSKNNETIDSVFYKSGSLILSLSSELSSDINFEISVSTTRNVNTNEPVTFTGSLPAGSNVTQTKDLANFKTILSPTDTSNNFELITKLTIFLDPGASTSADDQVRLTLTYQDQEFDILYGKFGQDTLTIGNEVLNIDFFNEIGNSGLEFGDPRISFNFTSTYGLPVGVLFKGMYGADSSASGLDTVYLGGSVTVNPQVIEASSTPGVPKTSKVELNNKNSTIQDLLSISPKSIGFNLTGITNPKDPTAENFVMDTSKVTTSILVTLPLELSLKDMERDFDFDLGSGLNFDEAETVTARLVSENGLPFSAHMTIEIRDSLENVIHTVPNEVILESPFIGKDGIVLEPRKYVADVPFDQDGVDALRVGKKLVLKVFLNTPGNDAITGNYVKVLADYKISVQVGLAGKLKANL